MTIFVIQTSSVMPIRFSLDSRPNQKGEYPIRFTWSYKGPNRRTQVRIQSTTGRAVPKECWFAPVQRAFCSREDARYAEIEKTNLLLEELEQMIRDTERRFSWLSPAMMRAIVHDFHHGDEEKKIDEQLLEGQLQAGDEETLFRKRGDDRHLYKRITEATDQATNQKMVVYRRKSGRTLFVASPNYFYSEFTQIKKEG